MEKERFECSVQLVKRNRRTGKDYKVWHFVGWYSLPNLENTKYKEKGDYIILKEGNELTRYRVK